MEHTLLTDEKDLNESGISNGVFPSNDVLESSIDSNAPGSLKRARILDESEDESEHFKNEEGSNQSFDSSSNAHLVKNTKRVRILDDSDDESVTSENKNASLPVSTLPVFSEASGKLRTAKILDESENEDSESEIGIFMNGIYSDRSENLSSSNFSEKEPILDLFNENYEDSNEINTTSKKSKMRDEFVLEDTKKKRKTENGKFDKLLQSRISKFRKSTAKQNDKATEANSEISLTTEECVPPINLDTDIFDAEGTDDENERSVPNNAEETSSDVDHLFEEQDSETEKSKKPKKEKKKKESKKARDQELMAIRSESQRLLRETAIKLPYHKPPKCSLVEFLNSRKKTSLPLDVKPFRSDTYRVLALKSSGIGQSQCTGEKLSHCNFENSELLLSNNIQQNYSSKTINSEFNDPSIEGDSSTNQHLMNDMSAVTSAMADPFHKENFNVEYSTNALFSHENTLKNSTDNLTNSENAIEVSANVMKNPESVVNVSTNVLNDLISALENSESVVEVSTNVLNDLLSFVENSERASEALPNTLKISTDILEKSNSVANSASLTLSKKDGTSPDQILKSKNWLCEDSDSDDEQITLAENEKNSEFVSNCLMTDSTTTRCETESHQMSFEIMKQKAIESAKLLTPRLSGSPNDLIVLDNGVSSTPPEKDFNDFIQMFVNHTKMTRKRRVNQEVKLSIVSKDETDAMKLNHSEICVNVSTISEEPELEKPGLRYLKLKERLLDEILKKKEAALIKKQKLEELDNELDPDMEEEEAELTDESDSEHVSDNEDIIDGDDAEESDHGESAVSIDDDCSEDDDSEGEENISFSSKRKRSLFINDEASVSGDDGEQLVSLKSVVIEDTETRSSSASKGSNSSHVSFSGIFPKEKKRPKPKQLNHTIVTAEPLEAKIDSNAQFIVPGNRSCTSSDEAKESDYQLNHQILLQKELKNKNEELIISDGSPPLFPATAESQLQRAGGSTPNIKGLLSSNSPAGIGDELLALCSGTFTGVNEVNSSRVAKELCFNNSTPSMTDVLDLCSGTFNSRPVPLPESVMNEDSEDSLPPISKRKMHTALSDLDDDSNSFLPGINPNDLNSESDHEKVDDDILSEKEESVGAEDEMKQAVDFFEDEAELSGDDVGSDADEDAEDGEYEEDFIPNEELPSDEELRDQIGKVHLKHLLDEDKRELRLYQELYLEDGELHNDGPGRQRKFTWQSNNLDNFLGGNSSNSGSDDDAAIEEEKWRLERYERQKFLQDEQNKVKLLEHSPMKPKWDNSVNVKILHKTKEPIVIMEKKELDLANTSSNSISKVSSGSILARGEDFLNSLSRKYKVNDSSVGCRTTKHFVFRTISPKKIEVKEKPSIRRTIAMEKRPKKVIRKVPNPKNKKSIFDLLDEGSV